MAKKKETNPLEVFEFHGVALTEDGDQAQGDCPFCGKEDHFFVNLENGLWDCKVCLESGNPTTFLRKLHEACYADTTFDQYKELGKERGVLVKTLKRWGVAFNPIMDEWVIPQNNLEGSLNNLYAWREIDGRMALLSSPGYPTGIFNLETMDGKDEVHICEGPWDGMAWEELLYGHKQSSGKLVKSTKGTLLDTRSVVATPGTIFRQVWAQMFEGKAVRVLNDNDHPRKVRGGKTVQPGWLGAKKTAERLEGSAGEVMILDWGMTRPKPKGKDRPEGYSKKYADGFDIRDLRKNNTPTQAWDIVTRGLVEPPGNGEGAKTKRKKKDDDEVQVEAVPCDSFKKLLDVYRRYLYVTPFIETTLAAMLATSRSTPLPGDQVWLRVIGPPGTAKSTLAEAMSPAEEYIYPISKFTGLSSGFDPKNNRKKAGLIQYIIGKCTIIKDADTLMTDSNRQKTLAEMRDVWDRVLRAQFMNMQGERHENVDCTFILCGTDTLRNLDKSSVGERFLDCEIFGDEQDRRKYLRKALDMTVKKIKSGLSAKDEKMKVDLASHTYGFLLHLHQNITNIPTMSDAIADKITFMGDFVAFMRTKPGEVDKLGIKPRVELGTRLSCQLAKMAICLAMVLGRKTVDSVVMKHMAKITRDTARGLSLDATTVIHWSRKGLTAGDIAESLKIGNGTASKVISNLVDIDWLERNERPNRSGARGRNRHEFVLTPQAKQIIKHAGVIQKPS